MLVELGGGTNPHPAADIVLDTRHPRGAPPQDVASGELWEKDNPGSQFPTIIEKDSVDEVYASHLMEHIPKGGPIINLMNKAWYVLKPGGVFTMIMPLIGYTDPHTGAPTSDHIGWQPWADPTHVQFWWLPEQIMYFCEGPFRPNADYGIRPWRALGPWIPEEQSYDSILPTFWSVRSGWEGIVRIQK